MELDAPKRYERSVTPADEADDLHEELSLQGAGESIWLLKVPDFLYARWAANPLQEAGNMYRVPAAKKARPGRLAKQERKKQPGEPEGDADSDSDAEFDISIVIPPQLAAAQQPVASTSKAAFTDAIPSEYTLTVTNKRTRNMYVFGETEGDGPARKRPREPFVLGTVKHEASVLPTIGAEYKEIVRQRQAKADAPRRRVQALDTDAATFNRLASGVTSIKDAAKFKGFVRTGPKGRNVDRAVRMERDDLQRELFTLFDEEAHWRLSEINGRVKQPVAWLQEVLAEIAILTPRGPYAGQYALKSNFKSQADAVEDGTEAKVEVDEDEVDFDEVA